MIFVDAGGLARVVGKFGDTPEPICIAGKGTNPVVYKVARHWQHTINHNHRCSQRLLQISGSIVGYALLRMDMSRPNVPEEIIVEILAHSGYLSIISFSQVRCRHSLI
jgi:hypothetical protein